MSGRWNFSPWMLVLSLMAGGIAGFALAIAQGTRTI
jgi:hypothetical protein